MLICVKENILQTSRIFHAILIWEEQCTKTRNTLTN